MRQLLLVIPALVLVACGPTSAPPPAAPAGAPMTTGMMGGMSATAAGDVGALTINADGLGFGDAEGGETFFVRTEFLGVVDAATPVREGGDSFATLASNANATRVELRRIVGAPPAEFCGMDATHVARVSSEPLTGLQLLVFTGAEAPGPQVRDSAICSIYAYAVD
ncbi:MAG: hypothetical protein R3C16_01030 [Hyphomonadaceae bacterium]